MTSISFKTINTFLARCIISSLAVFAYTCPSLAQQTLSTEGIVGDVDEGRRAPVLTFSIEVADDLSSAKILADTQVINEEYRKYPIVVDFFVNGKLFSRQFRSIELPGSLGIDVPKELAEVPFNYSIVATLLHSNRQFVTVAQGAVTADMSSNSSKLSCTLNRTSDSLNVEGEISDSLTANELKASFGDTTTAALDLDYTISEDSTTADVTGTIKITSDGTETSVAVSGTSETSSGKVTSLDISDADEDLTVTCEVIETAAATAGTDSATLKDTSSLGGLESAISGTSTAGVPAVETDSKYGPNFIPLDKGGGVVEVN